MTYEYEIRLERRFAQQIKCILGLYFIGQDAEMATLIRQLVGVPLEREGL